jgi:hypothetical protein
MAEAATNAETAADPSSVAQAPAAGTRAVSRVLLAVAAYALFRWALGMIRLPLGTPGPVLLAAFVVVALGSIGLPIAIIAELARARIPGRAGVLMALGGLALWFGLASALRVTPSWLFPLSATLQDLGKVLAAGGLGIALGNAIREPNILVPAGVFAAFADFVVVNFGTVHQALQSQKGQAVVAAVSAKVPALHPKLVPLTIGPADFLFLGIFLACAVKFGMGLRRNAATLALVLAGSLVVIQMDLLSALPALAPMSVTFVALNWRKFRLSREEIVSTAVVIALAGALFLGYFLFLFPKK